MATDVVTTTLTHVSFIPELWTTDTQDAIEFEEVVAKLVNTQFEKELSIGGRILHIPHRSNLTTQNKSVANEQATDPDAAGHDHLFEAITQTDQTITVSTYEYSAVLLTAVLQAQSAYDDRQALSHSMGYALMRGQEVSLTGLFGSFSQIVGTLGADLDDAILRDAWQALADAGFYQDSAWIFSPGMAASLFGNDKFTSKDFVNVPAIERAQLPNLYNHPPFVSNLLTAPATGQHNGALLHRTAVILTRQIQPTAKAQYLIRQNADAMLMFDLYSVDEAEQPAEAPGSEDLSPGDEGAVLVRGA